MNPAKGQGQCLGSLEHEQDEHLPIAVWAEGPSVLPWSGRILRQTG